MAQIDDIVGADLQHLQDIASALERLDRRVTSNLK
jgi:hypothetical protein